MALIITGHVVSIYFQLMFVIRFFARFVICILVNITATAATITTTTNATFFG